jgi:thiamine biosynthesis lipoprotein
MSATSVAGTRRVERHMGTAVSLQAHGASEDAADRFFDEIRSLEAKLSRFRHDSEVMRLERGELALDDASAQVREVLVRCDFLRTMTEGAFDHRPVVGGRRLLDSNAFAKGWIVEQALVHLRFAGVSQYFVNAGGDVVAGAGPPGQTSWRVGISHPDEPSTVFATIDLDHAAIATSGRYERGDHIRGTGSGSGSDELTSVSVVGPELATADALATAVFASGEARPSWWPRECPYGIIAVGASGRVRYTDNLADAVHLDRSTERRAMTPVSWRRGVRSPV